MFERTVVLTATRRMPFPASAVLSILQSPSDMIHLNPDVVSASQSEADPAQWQIDSAFSSFGGWLKWSTQYTAKFKTTEDGSVFEVKASAGVTTVSRWTCKAVVERAEAGEAADSGARNHWTDVTETAELTAPAYLMSFVTATRHQIHEVLMKSIEKRLEQ